jgi:hypothetical protein
MLTKSLSLLHGSENFRIKRPHETLVKIILVVNKYGSMKVYKIMSVKINQCTHLFE